MSSKSTTDTIQILDQSGRRRFIRAGTAFLLTSAAITGSRTALASDCDRGGNTGEEKPKEAGNGSDSDSGSNADPAGCGKHQENPKISQSPHQQESTRIVSVAKV